MFLILRALGIFVADMFKSRCRLQAENLFLRHQLNVALRRAPSRLRCAAEIGRCSYGRACLVRPRWFSRRPSCGGIALASKSSGAGNPEIGQGRPKIDRGLRDLIQRMSRENPLWGASRIHGELLMLGFEVGQSTVSKYMARPSKPPSQTWKNFCEITLKRLPPSICAVVPTLSFDRLFAFLVLGHGRRPLLWFEVTRHPTAEWLWQTPRRFPGPQGQSTCCATTTVPTDMSSRPGCGQWVSAIDRSLPNRRGRMAMLNV